MRSLASVIAWLLVSAHASLAQSPSRANENPSGTITLACALALTLRHSPELSAFSWDFRAAEARAHAALPSANQMLTLMTEGRVSQLEILDALRTLTDVRSQHLRALADCHKAVVEVEVLTAAPAVLESVPERKRIRKPR